MIYIAVLLSISLLVNIYYYIERHYMCQKLHRQKAQNDLNLDKIVTLNQTISKNEQQCKELELNLGKIRKYFNEVLK